MKSLLIGMLCLASLPAVVVAQTDEVKYVYDPDNRPDPFVPYKPLAVVVPPGQISVNGSKLVGITESHGTMIALFQAEDNKAHFLKVGDRVFDGVVEKITRDSVVFRQFSPEGSPVRQKEVVRRLYPDRE